MNLILIRPASTSLGFSHSISTHQDTTPINSDPAAQDLQRRTTARAGDNHAWAQQIQQGGNEKRGASGTHLEINRYSWGLTALREMLRTRVHYGGARIRPTRSSWIDDSLVRKLSNFTCKNRLQKYVSNRELYNTGAGFCNIHIKEPHRECSSRRIYVQLYHITKLGEVGKHLLGRKLFFSL